MAREPVSFDKKRKLVNRSAIFFLIGGFAAIGLDVTILPNIYADYQNSSHMNWHQARAFYAVILMMIFVPLAFFYIGYKNLRIKNAEDIDEEYSVLTRKSTRGFLPLIIILLSIIVIPLVISLLLSTNIISPETLKTVYQQIQ